MKYWMVVAVAIVVGVLAVVMVNQKKSMTPTEAGVVGNQPSANEETTVVPTAIPAGPVKEFTVEASPFKFVPAEIKVKMGDTVKITFKNTAGTHNLTIDQFEVQSKTLNAGEQDTVQFTPDRTGTFEYYCSVDSHKDKGMVGKLVVE